MFGQVAGEELTSSRMRVLFSLGLKDSASLKSFQEVKKNRLFCGVRERGAKGVKVRKEKLTVDSVTVSVFTDFYDYSADNYLSLMSLYSKPHAI